MIKKIIIGFIVVVGSLFLIIINPFESSSTDNNSTDDSQTISEYIELEPYNILKSYNKTDSKEIKLSKKQYQSLYNSIKNNTYDFEYADYYGLDNVLSLLNNTKINKKTSSELLNDDGLLDIDKLIKQIKNNNETYMSQGKDTINSFYKEMNSSDMYKIVNIICEVVNSKFIDVDINKTANTLMNLKMFEKTGSASNAYITNDMTFVYNPTMTSMYSSMQSITGSADSEEESFRSVITHEIMHLIQYASSDNNADNGIETGFCRMYNVPNMEKKVPVDSLWYSWLLDACAEINMAEYLNGNTGTYAKRISYVTSFNLSQFHHLDNTSLEDMAFYSSLNDVYKALNLKSDKEKLDFLKFMYSIEITQTDPDDFFENYISETNTSLSEEEKLSIRMKIREDAVIYLTNHFYLNLLDSIYEGEIKDLNTLFYFMKLWEIDAYSHLEYTKTTSYEYASDFITYQHEVQELIFDAFSSQIDNVRELYSDYTPLYKSDNSIELNCNLNNYSSHKQDYLSSLIDNYNTSHYVSLEDIYEYKK